MTRRALHRSAQNPLSTRRKRVGRGLRTQPPARQNYLGCGWALLPGPQPRPLVRCQDLWPPSSSCVFPLLSTQARTPPGALRRQTHGHDLPSSGPGNGGWTAPLSRAILLSWRVPPEGGRQRPERSVLLCCWNLGISDPLKPLGGGFHCYAVTDQKREFRKRKSNRSKVTASGRHQDVNQT